jgi:hypothetical protein
LEDNQRQADGLPRELLLAWVHLAVLWSFAFAKPLFDVLADSPEFFVARGNTRGDILIFAIGMVLVPPTLLVLLEGLVARLPAVRTLVHLLFVGGLFAAFAVQLLDDTVGGPSGALIAAAALLGVAAAYAYHRTAAVPGVLSVLGPAPLVFLLLFLFGSDVSKLVLPQGDAKAADVQIRSKAPVVVLVFDEFDSNMLMNARHRIDATRYPNLAALARDGTWYPNATTVNSQTTLAVPALLSGRRPTPDMLPIAADYPNSLFTLLGDSHAMHATETATHVCPDRLCGERKHEPLATRLRSLGKDLGVVSLHLVAPEHMESDLPAVDQTFGDFGGGGRDQGSSQKQPDVPLSALTNRPAQFDSFFSAIERQKGRPGLFFLHAALPHVPWQYLPGGQQYINAGPDYPGLEQEQWSRDPFPPRLGLQRALLQAAYADRLVGRLLHRLRTDGIYDRALIVITADHGVSFREGHPRRSPDAENFSDLASMPLLIKYPNRPGGRVDGSFVRTLDIVPTIAAELGVKLPWSAEGRPIGDGGPTDGEVSVRAGSSDKVMKTPFSQFLQEHEAGLQRMIFLFGAGQGLGRLYGNGGNSDLLGRPVRGLAKAPPISGQLQLDGAELLDRFRPGAHLVPSFISGRISGGVAPGESLAVAVDGTIRGVTETFSHDDGVRIAAIVPVDSFHAGSNSVEAFVVSGTGGARRLAPLPTQRPASYRIVEEDGKTAIQSGGRRIDVSEGAIKGFVDSFLPDDQGARIAGWAVARDDRRAAERILVFAHGELVAQGAPTVDRPDIQAQMGDSAAKSGFEVRAGVAGADAADFRVFAVYGGEATELPRYDE